MTDRGVAPEPPPDDGVLPPPDAVPDTFDSLEPGAADPFVMIGDVEARGDPLAEERPAKRPIIERLGLAFIALVLGALFGSVAAAAWSGGEIFLAAMGAIGCAMTLWVGGLTLFRG